MWGAIAVNGVINIIKEGGAPLRAPLQLLEAAAMNTASVLRDTEEDSEERRPIGCSPMASIETNIRLHSV